VRRHRGSPTKCELVSSFPRERGSELEGAGIGEQLLGPALGKKKLSFSLAGTLLVGRTDYEHWARVRWPFASTALLGTAILRRQVHCRCCGICLLLSNQNSDLLWIDLTRWNARRQGSKHHRIDLRALRSCWRHDTITASCKGVTRREGLNGSRTSFKASQCIR